jgi:hypothetical protein
MRRVLGFLAPICAAAACALDLSRFDSGNGDAARPDAFIREASSDLGAPPHEASTACHDAACGFCASLHPAPFFCADWDEGPDAAAGWTSSTSSGGEVTVDRDAWVSPPASLLASGGNVTLTKVLPNPSTLEAVHIEVDVATNCTSDAGNCRFVSLACIDETDAGGSAIVEVQGGDLGVQVYSPRLDGGYLVEGGVFGSGDRSKLALTPSWSHLVVDLTPPYGVAMTLGDGGPAFTSASLGYGCPRPKKWTVSLEREPTNEGSCEFHFDNFTLSYTTKDGGSG